MISSSLANSFYTVTISGTQYTARGTFGSVINADHANWLATNFAAREAAGYYIGGYRLSTSDDFYYPDESPFRGQKLYTYSNGRCYKYCAFPQMSNDPTKNQPTPNGMFLQNKAKVWTSVPAYTCSGWFLVEWMSNFAPYVPSIPTIGGVFTITNLVNAVNNFGWFSISVYVVDASANNAVLFTPTYLSTAGNTMTYNFSSANHYGAGITPKIRITDVGGGGMRTYDLPFEYELPYASMVYPPNNMQSGSTLTIVGGNFGDGTSGVPTFSFGTNPTPCTNVQYLVPHTVVTCTMPFTPSDTYYLYPFTITLANGRKTQSNPPIYHAPTLRAIRIYQTVSAVATVRAGISVATSVDNNKAYQGIIQTYDQMLFIRKIIPFDITTSLWVGAQGSFGNGVTISNLGGPRDNQVLTAPNSYACSPGYFCSGLSNLPGSGVYSLGYNPNDNTQPANMNGKPGGGELTFFGVDPANATSNPVFQIATTGDTIFFNVAGSVGFRYSARAYYLDGVAGPGPITYINSTCLSLYIPAGSGQATHNLNVTIESMPCLTGTYVYKPSNIASVSSVSALGGTIVVNGINFGTVANQIVVLIGTQPCTSVSILVNHLKFQCTAPPGKGANLILSVSVNGQTTTGFFSYDAPAITSIVQTGTQLLITGTSFGIDSSALVITPPCPQLAAFTTTAIQSFTCTYPINPTNAGYNVSLGNQNSNIYDFAWQPTISDVTPTHVAPGGTVTITGTFLSLTRYNGSQTANGISINNLNYCTGATLLDVGAASMRITCSAPSSQGTNMPLKVVIDGKSTSTLPITINMPTTSSITFSTTTNNVTIVGKNFGDDPSLITIYFNLIPVAVDQVLQTGLPIGSKTLIARVPNNVVSGVYGIKEYGIYSTPTTFTLIPTVTNVQGYTTLGGDIQVSGYYFNQVDFNGQPVALTCSISGIKCSPIVSTVSTFFTCTMPSATGINLPVVVKVGNVSSTSNYKITYPAPVITSLVQEGTYLSIIGTDFGKDNFVIDAKLSPSLTYAVPTLYWNTGTIRFPLYSYVLNGPVSVWVNGQTSNSLYLTLVPIITLVDVPSTQGGLIGITGNFLSGKDASNQDLSIVAMIDGTIPCDGAASVSNSKITCTAPGGTGTQHTITLTIQGNNSNTIPFSYSPPTLNPGAVQASKKFTMTGTNLGGNVNVVNFVFGTFNTPASSVSNHNTFDVYIPLAATNGYGYVNVDGQKSNSISINLQPTITSVTSVGVQGGPIIISGLFLNTLRQNGTNTDISITMQNGQACQSIEKLEDNSDGSNIKCTAPAGTGKSKITVIIDGLSDVIDFAYGAPVIQTIESDSSNVFTIAGTNFGTDPSAVVLTWGSTPISTFTLNGTAIVFGVGSTFQNSQVYITVGGQISNKKNANLVPTITSFSNLATSGGQVFISGSFVNPNNLDGSPCTVVVHMDGNNMDIIVDSDYIIFDAPAGSGTGHTVTMSVNGVAALGTNTLNYMPPKIGTSTQDGQALTIAGDNFGTDASKLTVPTGWTVTKVVHTSLEVNLPPTTRNQIISITVDTQVSNDYEVYLRPGLASITTVTADGGNITLTGIFLNDKRDNGTNTDLSIRIDSTICVFVSTTGTNLVCTLPSGPFSHSDVTVTVDGVTMVSAESYSTNQPTVLSASSLVFQQPGVVTVMGTNFAQGLVIKIASVDCDNPILISSTIATCEFVASVPQSSNVGLDVLVSIGPISGHAAVFLYNTRECPAGCADNGHQCQFGYCVCKTGFADPSCSTVVSDPVTAAQPNSTTVGFPLSSDVNFFAGLTYIREVSGSTPIKTLSFHDATWVQQGATVGDEDATIKTFVATFTGENLVVTLTAFTFGVPTNASFAGETIPVPAHTVKHTVKVEHWTFADTDNSLQVVYSGFYPTTVRYNCSDANVVLRANASRGEFVIDSPVGILVTQFSSRGYVDGRVMVIHTNRIASSDPIYNGAAAGTIHLGVNMQSFGNSISFDPTFIAFKKPALSPAPSCPTPTTSTTITTTSTTTATTTASTSATTASTTATTTASTTTTTTTTPASTTAATTSDTTTTTTTTTTTDNPSSTNVATTTTTTSTTTTTGLSSASAVLPSFDRVCKQNRMISLF
ncbi:hypothetical protein SAMD00019534_057210 [Acytostelium subglobosum LB1]|uniref:hypothetical protein n=1 Tax=Acytostelium subglobosum LB1 TaxID=1410327 RepID=UPI0006449871|nr:hypothetical protein SAMD00019534_057210 [Acytostelium subglobosum LB1]GAM22546.1 hypothetical protein SAMD00019534_057210 [Acytostelium subglobosum LB1]|eukprot:XP_012754666.1 hypothetical protein SAMD00019534_057210 [Acytostelium subglobosum LB1]